MEMKILLDTSAYVAFKLNQEEAVDVIVNAGTILFSPIVIGELMFGFRNGNRFKHNMNELNLFLEHELDEIPQMWNVLKGNMSFVGPRPERPEFVGKLKKIIPYYSERHTVKPGITGWAQISYRYGASVDDALEKLKYDLFYIKNMSMFMDLAIVLSTIKIVLHKSGAR